MYNNAKKSKRIKSTVFMIRYLKKLYSIFYNLTKKNQTVPEAKILLRLTIPHFNNKI